MDRNRWGMLRDEQGVRVEWVRYARGMGTLGGPKITCPRQKRKQKLRPEKS